MFQELTPLEIAIVVVLLVISLGVHEAAHAWMAWRRGDSTAKDLGRMTLNPIPHIDPMLTLVMPAMLLLISNGTMWFGGAKPVPVDFTRLRRPYRDMALVALAGPLSNLLIALFLGLLFKLAFASGYYTLDQRLDELLRAAIFFNVLLFVFNLLPIPPLDGSRVMTWLLPRSMRAGYLAVEPYGILIVMVLFFTSDTARDVLHYGFQETMRFVNFTVSLGGLW